tara:strand:- start:70 stop:1056 length:987 start_codon:yes stop_codon:yes gene_type:complete
MKNNFTFICESEKDHFSNYILLELEKKFDVDKIISNSKLKYLISLFSAEIYWIEWASNPAIFISKYKTKKQKLFIRLHRYEMYKNKWMQKIRWDNVDKVIFVNSELEHEFKTLVPNCNTITIPNAVNIETFPLSQRTNENTLLSYGYQFNPIKGYLDLIELFNNLNNIDSSFNLTIAGKNPDNDIYKIHLNECYQLIKKYDLESNINIKLLNISAKELLEHKNINHLLTNHNGIISYSLEESFHYAFAEGLTSGLEGFCNGWRKLNPQQFWSNWCYDNESAMIQGLLNWGKMDISKRNANGLKNRDYIKNNYSIKIIANLYANLFSEK